MTEPVPSAPRIEYANPQVNLYAEDIERSVRFYRDLLGFTETFRIPRVGVPAHVELELGPFKLGLAAFDALSRDHGIRTARGPARVEIALFTKDVDGAYGWSVAHGAETLRAPQDFGGYIHNAIVADPDGNPIVFTTRLPVRTSTDRSRRPVFTDHLYNVLTADMGKALGCYRDLLGSRETFRVPKEGPADHVEMELGPLKLAVSTLRALERDHGISAGGGPPRGEVVLWVPDADAAYAWMTRQEMPGLSPPHDFANGLRAGWVTDPDGNPLQVVARRTVT